MQSADGQDMAGTRGLEGLSGVLAEAAFLAQCYGGDDGLLLRCKMLAANVFCEFASQTESLQAGAVERRQMAVGTRCCGLPVLLFLQRGEQGASYQEGGEDEERLVQLVLHQDGEGRGGEHDEQPVGGRKGDDVEVRNDNARHKHQAESLSGARIEELSPSEDCLCARNLHLIFNFCKYRNFFSSKCSFFCNFAKFYRIQ